jgi:hypothetical protein
MLHRRFPNLFRINKILIEQFLKFSKTLITPLTVTCKKTRVDGNPNKKHNKSNKNDSFTLALAFFQFEESSNKIERIKIKMHSQMAK